MLKKIMENKKALLLVALIYTLIICFITVIVDRAILRSQFENSIKDVFSGGLNNIIATQGPNSSSDNKGNTIKTESVGLNQIATSNNWEVEIIDAKFTKEVAPEEPDMFSSRYEIEDIDKTYFVLTIKAKNISTTSLDYSKITSMKAKYDGKYEYESFSVVEEKGSFRSYGAHVEPLTKAKVHYLFEMPKTVQDDDKTLEIVFTLDDIEYTYKAK